MESQREVVYTRDGRAIDKSFRTEGELRLLERVQGNASLKAPTSAHPSVAKYCCVQDGGSGGAAGAGGGAEMSIAIATPVVVPRLVSPAAAMALRAAAGSTAGAAGGGTARSASGSGTARSARAEGYARDVREILGRRTSP